MGNPRGVQRDFVALEARRLRAAELLKKGWCQAEVAREVGVHRQSVSRWAAALDVEGKKGLKATGGRGRRARLTAADLVKLEAALERGPEALGYESGLWTLQRITDLIRQECGVDYHPGHVWKILRRLKWSVQRPTDQAVERNVERNEEAIEHWKHLRWPRVKSCLPREERPTPANKRTNPQATRSRRSSPALAFPANTE